MFVSGRVSPEDSMILYVTSQDADFDGSGTLDREEFVEICSLAKNMRNKKRHERMVCHSVRGGLTIWNVCLLMLVVTWWLMWTGASTILLFSQMEWGKASPSRMPKVIHHHFSENKGDQCSGSTWLKGRYYLHLEGQRHEVKTALLRMEVLEFWGSRASLKFYILKHVGENTICSTRAFTSTWTRWICPRRCRDIGEKTRLPGLPSPFYHGWSPINLFDTPFRIDWSGHGPLLAAVISALLTDPSWATGRAVWYPGWGLAIMCIEWASDNENDQKNNQTILKHASE